MQWQSIATSTDAIVAISSPLGCSARGIVRVSGDTSFALVRERLVGGTLTSTRGVHRVRVSLTVAGEPIELPALALVMVGPSSFTGQDTVELLVAGHQDLLNALVDALCDASRGAHAGRRAIAGEFSARAFLNGRIAMDEAEAIALSIAAESDAQLDAARTLREGRVGTVAAAAAHELTGALALVEAGIDFSDQEDVVAISAGDLVGLLDAVSASLETILDGSTPEESLRSLPIVALRGATNAGKSSLFNALLCRERVVTSHHPGSTRDAIVEPLTLHRGREVLLMDLPGIEDPQHALDEAMQQVAHHGSASATVRLSCVALSTGVARDLLETHASDGGRPTVRVWTQADRVDAATRAHARTHGGYITSARTGEGIDELREALTQQLDEQGWIGGAREAPVLLARHRAAIVEATRAMRRARDAAQRCVEASKRAAEPAELIATDLREALDALGVVAGHRTADDVLSALFARFCIGK